ncbi:MAG: helix-turn-helix domain-containing protein [Thermoplasmataceae archaeon]
MSPDEIQSFRERRKATGLTSRRLAELATVGIGVVAAMEFSGMAVQEKRKRVYAALERAERGETAAPIRETQPDKRLIDETRFETFEGIAEPSAPIYETDPAKSLKVAEAILKNPEAKKVFSHVSVNAGPLVQTDSPSFDDLIRELSSNPRVREIRFATIVMEG